MLPIKTNNIDLCDLDFLIITSWSKKKNISGGSPKSIEQQHN